MTEASPKREVRARLTVRGFKDSERGDIDRYAGTSSRCAKKVLASEAVRNHWPICTANISKAFLQGVTYEKLAALTGEPMREVNFYLPASNISLLRQIKGFEDFDPQNEILHCDKPGTGLVDAPRAFSLRLRSVTENKCNMKSSKVDPELCMRHHHGSSDLTPRLLASLTKHVDDLKIIWGARDGERDPEGTPESVRRAQDRMVCLHQLWCSSRSGCQDQRDHFGSYSLCEQSQSRRSSTAIRWKSRG